MKGTLVASKPSRIGERSPKNQETVEHSRGPTERRWCWSRVGSEKAVNDEGGAQGLGWGVAAYPPQNDCHVALIILRHTAVVGDTGEGVSGEVCTKNGPIRFFQLFPTMVTLVGGGGVLPAEKNLSTGLWGVGCSRWGNPPYFDGVRPFQYLPGGRKQVSKRSCTSWYAYAAMFGISLICSSETNVNICTGCDPGSECCSAVCPPLFHPQLAAPCTCGM